jgi:hypothetical protein
VVKDVAGQQQHVRRRLTRGAQHQPQRVQIIAAVVQTEMQVRGVDKNEVRASVQSVLPRQAAPDPVSDILEFEARTESRATALDAIVGAEAGARLLADGQ